jgi:thymidylate synthase
MSFQIEVNQIADGWETLVRKIMDEGNEIKDERGSLTREILNTLVTITDPLGIRKLGDKNKTDFDMFENIRVPTGYFWKGEKLKIYSEQFISNDKHGFVYTYGNRLRAHFDGIDQIQVAIDRLKNCKESRRSISVTWDPTIDTRTDEVPCMILVDFKIRNEELHTTALWRSHDIYGAWFPNAVGLTYLTKYAADQLGIEVGTVTIHSISAHIYGVNFDDAKHTLNMKRFGL